MKAEFLKGLSNQALRNAYDAYITLQGIYEDYCNGPRGAMQYREYFGLRDSVSAIVKEFNERQAENHGRNRGQETKGGTN